MKRTLNENKIGISIFILTFLMGTFVRIINLEGSPAFWWDEGFYCNIAENMAKGKFMILSYHFEPRLYLSESQPQYCFYNMPFWFILVAISFSLFGVGVFQARIVSVLFDMLTMIFIFKFGKELYSEKTGFIAMLIYSLDFYAVYIGRTAEHDNIEAFFVILALYLWYQASSKKENNKPFLIGSGIAAGFAVLSKLIGLLSLFVIWGLVVFRFISERDLKKRILEFVIPTVFCVGIVGPYIVIAYSIAGDTFILQTTDELFYGPRRGYFLGGAQYLLSYTKENPLLFIAGMGFIFACLKREKSDIFLIIWLIIPVILFSIMSVVPLRFITPMFATFSISSSRMLTELFKIVSLSKGGKFHKFLHLIGTPESILAVLIYFISIIALVSSTGKVYTLLSNPNYELSEVADYLDKNILSETTIIGQPAISFLSRNHTLYDIDYIMMQHKGPNQYNVNYQRIRSLHVEYIIVDPWIKETPGISPELEFFLEEYCIIEKTFENTELYRVISYDFKQI